MKLLLDTHIFLWYITDDPRLTPPIIAIIRDPFNEVYLSVISIWEVIVKCKLGKLYLPQSPDIYIPQQRQRHKIESIPIDEDSVVKLIKLPLLHKDPFDRMLLCQALQYDLTVVSVDEAVRAYSGYISVVP